MRSGPTTAQDIAWHFSNFLEQCRDFGLLLCDGRDHHQDAQMAHSIFTMKHRRRGDRLPYLIEVAAFGRSVNHGSHYVLSGPRESEL